MYMNEFQKGGNPTFESHCFLREMPECRNCGGFITDQNVQVFAPFEMDTVRVCPICEDKLRDGAEIREAHSPRNTND